MTLELDIVERMAQRLHYIDYFYEQRDIGSDWALLEQRQRNKYLNYAGQMLKIVVEETLRRMVSDEKQKEEQEKQSQVQTDDNPPGSCRRVCRSGETGLVSISNVRMEKRA